LTDRELVCRQIIRLLTELRVNQLTNRSRAFGTINRFLL